MPVFLLTRCEFTHQHHIDLTLVFDKPLHVFMKVSTSSRLKGANNRVSRQGCGDYDVSKSEEDDEPQEGEAGGSEAVIDDLTRAEMMETSERIGTSV